MSGVPSCDRGGCRVLGRLMLASEGASGLWEALIRQGRHTQARAHHG